MVDHFFVTLSMLFSINKEVFWVNYDSVGLLRQWSGYSNLFLQRG